MLALISATHVSSKSSNPREISWSFIFSQPGSFKNLFVVLQPDPNLNCSQHRPSALVPKTASRVSCTALEGLAPA